MAMALELVKMVVVPGREEQFLSDRPAAVSAIRDACPGFRAARLFRGEEPGVWYDVWFWRSVEEARQAARLAAELPAAAAWFGHIQDVVMLEHATLVHEVTADAP